MTLLTSLLVSVSSTVSPGGKPKPDRTEVDALFAESLREASMLDILDAGGVAVNVDWWSLLRRASYFM
jgi:hypothetical protein